MNDVTDGRPVRTLWWVVLGSVTGLLLVVTATLVADLYDLPVLVAFGAATAGCVALPLVPVRPRLAAALQLAAVVVFAWTQPIDEGAWPLAVPVMLVLILYVGLVGLCRPWGEAVATWWASGLILILLATFDPRGRDFDAADETLVVYATNSVLVLFGAILWRQRALIRRQLADARRDVALEQAQRAVVEERTRIARELHDVVAHSMSVIHMQATSAAYRLQHVDEESRAEFGRIAAGTRTALREMRQLLSLLRDEEGERPLRPAPGLRDLDELAVSARRGGIAVALTVPDEVRDLAVPETVGVAAFRIVQESLSNVVRHAPGADTRVRVGVTERALTVEVVNDRARRARRAIEDPGRAGHGLIGMRERARQAGGTLETGPRPEGGYRVAACLPLNSEENES
ncbi:MULTISPECIES: sensor histidine kinase [Catenuloplanes]|uniref:histidine kinase n=1 Tax=Catenuloplanes niger TaxID=587534 RepID=A0AAE3ZJF7_9ACTN|nr:histidine kinase [Catenuloplanes niger]MDR7320266.1 signal transduction histidine kinase [Catenuloplanes niger]